MNVSETVEALTRGDRRIIAQTITLMESEHSEHRAIAHEVLSKIMPLTGRSLRIGVTGVPGVGKSTFIDQFGSMLAKQGRRIAVLAVDPSSALSGGSILGDKTRMSRLSREPDCFVRPSPSRGILGGVARSSMESLLVLEAAGFDVILVETVGVGQSETAVRAMVDFFLLLMLPNAGDSLQGVKRGIMELADALFINKADGENRPAAMAAKMEYEQSVHYLRPATEGWKSPVLSGSALSGEGIEGIWEAIVSFEKAMKQSGAFESRRQGQLMEWLRATVSEQVVGRFWRNPAVIAQLGDIEEKISRREVDMTEAIDALIRSTGI